MIPINRARYPCARARARASERASERALGNQDRFDHGGQKFSINSMRDAAHGESIRSIDRSIDRRGTLWIARESGSSILISELESRNTLK